MMRKPGPRRGAAKRARLSAEDSQNRILAATLKLLPRHGWEATSFQMIADACGTSQSNVLYHFKTKELLLLALINNISNNNFRMVSEALRPEHNALERIIIHCRKNLEWAQKYPEEAQIIVLIYYNGCHSRDFSIIFDQVLRKAQNRLREHVLAGMREKIFDPPLDPVRTSKILHNVLVGAFINISSGRFARPDTYPEEEWQAIVASLTGYRANP